MNDPTLNFVDTHPDVAGTFNSRPVFGNAISNAPPLAPGANQVLAVAGGSQSTGNPTTDINRKVSGQIPGTSIAISNPA